MGDLEIELVRRAERADGPIDSSRWYQVINANSGKGLDLTDFGTANGSPLQQWTCSAPAATNQTWQFRPVGNG